MTSGGDHDPPDLDVIEPTGALDDAQFGLDDAQFGLDLEDLLNPDEQRRFRRLCIETSPEELEQLTEVVELHLGQVKANARALTDVETAELVAESIQKVLAFTPEFDDRQRALVRGAVEYFVLNEDAFDDLSDALGFDDDARVLNSVLERIGRSDLKVQLQR